MVAQGRAWSHQGPVLGVVSLCRLPRLQAVSSAGCLGEGVSRASLWLTLCGRWEERTDKVWLGTMPGWPGKEALLFHCAPGLSPSPIFCGPELCAAPLAIPAVQYGVRKEHSWWGISCSRQGGDGASCSPGAEGWPTLCHTSGPDWRPGSFSLCGPHRSVANVCHQGGPM